MENKNILMWMSESSLKPVGGPVGYLFNIYKEVRKQNIRSIHFLPPQKKAISLKAKLIKVLIDNFKYVKFYSYEKFLLKKTILEKGVDLNYYDIIHFHDTISLFKAREIINNFRGKIILTSHSPEPLHKELVDNNYSDLKPKQKKIIANILNFIDEYSFLRADFIMFPCETAKEPYYAWPFFNKVINEKKDKFIYCPTGTSLPIAKFDKETIRQKYNISSEAFVISYVGRHNSIKGYDNLKLIGNQILEKNPNFYFLIAGVESPLKGIKNDRWIEVGFTSDPHSLIAASDLFILPNKETFFDLIFLEVLGLGTTILASYTGGNKYFEKFENLNLEYFTTFDEAILKINKIKNHNKEYDRTVNVNLFNKFFLTSFFVSRYLVIVNNLS